MKSIAIQLTTAENVQKFTAITSKYPYDIDIRSDRYVVNAKSILGIFSLNLTKPLVLEIHNNDSAQLIEELNEYIIKN